MAKRHIIPLGKHKPLRSSWGSYPMVNERKPIEPYCYRDGQSKAMLEHYNRQQEAKSIERGIAILETLM